MASVQADEETYSLEETILIRKKKCSTGECFQANDSQGRFFYAVYKMAISDQNHMLKVSISFNPRGAGESSRRNPAERAALGGKYYPSANSRTNHRRGTSEAVIESSQHGDSCELLKFS